MTTAVTHKNEGSIARPLHVLVPLIKKDLAAAEEAAERASMPYYVAAGEKIGEAKGQMSHAELGPWLKRNFDISYSQAQSYVKFAETVSPETGSRRLQEFSSLTEFNREHRGHTSPQTVRPQAWHDPIKSIVNRVDVDALNLRRTEMNRVEERDAQRKLALQLIDIGYKALATKLHPDKGGSRDAMARLNAVRDRLKQHA